MRVSRVPNTMRGRQKLYLVIPRCRTSAQSAVYFTNIAAIQNVVVLQQIRLYETIGGMLLMCQNGARVKAYYVLCSKTYSSFSNVLWSRATSRQATRGAHISDNDLLLLVKYKLVQRYCLGYTPPPPVRGTSVEATITGISFRCRCVSFTPAHARSTRALLSLFCFMTRLDFFIVSRILLLS